MPISDFHPAVAAWFERAFATPTPAQARAWPAIAAGKHTLIAAPTGSGKTLAAFLAAIDELIRRGLEAPLPDETAVVYVSPLKALSNDVRINLDVPLAGIRAELARTGLSDVEITTVVRTGDTPQAERGRMRKCAPHIVVTTPESLYILLGSESGRRMLATTKTVIVDEIHALAPNKRGAHLALSLARLDALCGRRLQRIGLSATQKPIDVVAGFLIGDQERPLPARGHFPPHAREGTTQGILALNGSASFPCTAEEGAGRRKGTPSDNVDGTGCEIVDAGHARPRDLAIELPEAPLEAVMSGDSWAQVHTRLEKLIGEHRTTLIFVNTRRMAERLARHLSERIGREYVTAHHGSLSKEHRFDAEQRLKRGDLRALVATASLELGIDIGDVDLVCQIGSPRAIATFLQRVGRSGHAVDGTPKGRLFPESRDQLVECAALLDAVARGELDALRIERAPLDMIAQHIVAEVACGECGEDDLFELVVSAQPFADLPRATFDTVIRMLAEGFTSRRGPRGAYIQRDAVNRVLRASRGARLTAITSGGAIPDTADYDVVLEPSAMKVGTLNEDFAVESSAGDIFQLGNQSYRVLRVERGRVRVEDAHGAPPTIPFWIGEAPGRSDELSAAVSRLRADISEWLDDGADVASAKLAARTGIAAGAAEQIVEYLAQTKAALGIVPTQAELAMERFFDESGGTQLVIHTPFGSRINRAWGLALRKRFCRKFNFELQAAATEDAIVLSLSTSHSFPLDDVSHYLNSASVREVLTQALLDAPMFAVRWRWNAVGALALPRYNGGKRVPPQIQRMKSEDLLATVFPDQVACAENLVGERVIPEHPLVAQTLRDCLETAMDIDGLIALLSRLEDGSAHIVARDLPAPSPLAAEVLSARPYAFLDDAPLEERRTQAVTNRRYHDPSSADDLGRLDADAIDAVRAEAWPDARTPDDLHASLLGVGFVTADEVRANTGWGEWLTRLGEARRATLLSLRRSSDADASGAAASGIDAAQEASIWVAAERLPQFDALEANATRCPDIVVPTEFAAVAWSREDAMIDILRARLTALGPVRTSALAASLVQTPAAIEAALLTLEADGFVMRGQFSAPAPTQCSDVEWCERHLLARIHRYTLKRLRREIEPVEPRDFMRFLFEWQHVAPGTQVSGPDALALVLAQLDGYEAAASAWESAILPARIDAYEIAWLDGLCQSGRVVWARLRGHGAHAAGRIATAVRATPITLMQRRHRDAWFAFGARAVDVDIALGSRAQVVAEYLARRGASFFDDVQAGTGLLETELENALGELVASGVVNADGFGGLRALLVPTGKRGVTRQRRGRRHALFGLGDAGRWSLLAPLRDAVAADSHDRPNTRDDRAIAVEHVAQTLLRRYGVVGWRMLAHEAAWLPPWRELVRVYQRLEARGEIRGGRFVAGMSGEQFALPDAIAALRSVRARAADATCVAVSGADPLNLVGNVIAGDHVPRLASARVVYCDGVPVAKRVAGNVELLARLDRDGERRVRECLTSTPLARWQRDRRFAVV